MSAPDGTTQAGPVGVCLGEGGRGGEGRGGGGERAREREEGHTHEPEVHPASGAPSGIRHGLSQSRKREFQGGREKKNL